MIFLMCILYHKYKSYIIPWNILKFNYKQTVQWIIISLMPIEPETLQVFSLHQKCSMCLTLLIRQTFNRLSNSFHTHVSMSRSISATAAVIQLRNSWRLAGTGGTKTVSFTNPHKKKSQGVRSGDLGGQRINATSSCPKCVIQCCGKFVLRYRLFHIEKIVLLL